ncbi:hypothetical protein BOX15_Mlig026057g1, partial [Macrostomum lignano]
EDLIPILAASCGQYSIMEIIGSGTYGVVYKTWDNLHNRPVALKKFKAERFDNDFNGAPLPALKEISILIELKRTNHSNIVNLRDVLEIGPDCYMVLDYMDWDLFRLIYHFSERRKHFEKKQEHQRQFQHAARMPTGELPPEFEAIPDGYGLPPELYQSIAMQLLEAVRHCHSMSIVHRDIKPANILLSNRGVVKLADFGMARSLSHRRRTLNLSVVTLPYRAPELLLGTPDYTEAVDVWSVGCVIAEMITGYHLFYGDSEIHQLFLIFERMGTPDNSNWLGVEQLPDYNRQFPRFYPHGFRDFNLPICAEKLIRAMLRLDPTKRSTASAALKHKFFFDTTVQPLALFLQDIAERED